MFLRVPIFKCKVSVYTWLWRDTYVVRSNYEPFYLLVRLELLTAFTSERPAQIRFEAIIITSRLLPTSNFFILNFLQTVFLV